MTILDLKLVRGFISVYYVMLHNLPVLLYILCTFFQFEMIPFKSSAYKKIGVKGTERDHDGELGGFR